MKQSKLSSLEAGAEIHAGDGGYGIGTQENYEAFVKKREWVGLDFDMIEDCFGDGDTYSTEENGILVTAQWLHDFAHAIEAKLKEKNT